MCQSLLSPLGWHWGDTACLYMPANSDVEDPMPREGLIHTPQNTPWSCQYSHVLRSLPGKAVSQPLLSWVQGINLFQCLRLEKRETLVREKSMRWALGCVPAGPSPPPDATSWATKPQTPTETFPILPSLPVPVLISQGKASCKSLSSLHLNKSLLEPLASNKWEGFMITVWLTGLW